MTNVIYGEVMKIAEVDFLCIHSAFRSQRMAPVLISEITHRVTRNGIDKAIYTVANKIPTPFGMSRYYHRSLDIDYLIRVGFTDLPEGKSLELRRKELALPNKMSKNIIRMEESHVSDAFTCLSNYLQKYDCYPMFTLEEFRHLFLNDIVKSFVVLNEDNRVVDLLSYYELESTVVQDGTILRSGNLFYYSALETDIRMSILNLMIHAKNSGVHTFTAMDLMENQNALPDLRFELGTGTSYYYMYNYRVPSMESNRIGKIIA